MTDAFDTPAIAAFLARNGQADADLRPLPGDASARRYARLAGAGLLLMEDRADPVGFAAFLRLSAHLRGLGLSAPRVVAEEPAEGLALIEDFGTGTYGALLRDGADEAALYALAVDALVHLHRAPNAAEVDVPAYDMTVLLDELSIFSNWFAPILRPGLDVAAFDRQFRSLWAKALAPVADCTDALVLRDFHIDNLMLLPDRSGVARCGLLDFQDALRGAAEYDLVSLLQDARRDLAPGLEDAMLHRYLAGMDVQPEARAAILHRYHLLGAQRHCRIVGLFPRLHQRDGKPGYLVFLPRVLRQMETALAAADLHEIAAFLDTELPGWRSAAQGHRILRPA